MSLIGDPGSGKIQFYSFYNHCQLQCAPRSCHLPLPSALFDNPSGGTVAPFGRLACYPNKKLSTSTKQWTHRIHVFNTFHHSQTLQRFDKSTGRIKDPRDFFICRTSNTPWTDPCGVTHIVTVYLWTSNLCPCTWSSIGCRAASMYPCGLIGTNQAYQHPYMARLMGRRIDLPDR